MGTKMECENYSPGYFFSRMNHLNEVTQPNWSICHEQHTMPNRHLIHGDGGGSSGGGGFRSLANTFSNGGGYLDYDTQVLKQTMLTHEATFRNQVHELHRVYRVQREMMDELKKADRFSSRPYSSQLCASPDDDNDDGDDDDDEVVEINKEIVTLPFFGTRTTTSSVSNGGAAAASANVKLSLGICREFSTGLVDLNQPVSESCEQDRIDHDAAAAVGLSNGRPSVNFDLGSQIPGKKLFWKKDMQCQVQNSTSHRSLLNGIHPCDRSGNSVPSNSQQCPSSFGNSSSQKVENYSRMVTGGGISSSPRPPLHHHLAGGQDPTGFRNQIDLNSSAEFPSDQTSSRRFVLDIDLEVPAEPEESFKDPVEDHPDIESNGKQENVGGEDEDEIVRFTAGIIVSMVSDIASKGSVAPLPSETNSSAFDVGCLTWFADVAISFTNAKEPETAPLVSSDADDGMDFFESMTLKLTESQPEHSTEKPCPGHAEEDGEENGFASMLLTMGRKVQGKKRRQKKDFQKDILPGLSSLSKHEVTEDLQSFEKMMTASGLSWKVAGARRNARQRRRRPKAASVSASTQISSDPNTTTEVAEVAEMGVDNKGGLIGGWGRTRRCRRQRWASSSLAAAAACASASACATGVSLS